MHAYLVVAHKNPRQLKKLFSQIDDKRNDIYVLFDKKTNYHELINYDYGVSKSKLTFLKPVKINWGGYSQINAYLKLMEQACTSEYDYYHFISGQDLLLKDQNYIHSYFAENAGFEFISISKQKDIDALINKRISKYYFFQEHIGDKKKRRRRLFIFLERISLKIQYFIGIDRKKRINLKFAAGPNWCSLTHNFVLYILHKKSLIKKIFKNTLNPDEIFIQTLLINSPFVDKVTDNLRYIDWDRGKPYTFRQDDYNTLINNNCVFARKFDTDIDSEIVDKITQFTNIDTFYEKN